MRQHSYLGSTYVRTERASHLASLFSCVERGIYERRYDDVVADRADSYLRSCYDGSDYRDVGGCEMDERQDN